MRFLFFYLTTDDAVRVSEVAPRHAAYWAAQDLPQFLGGPFADRTGGLVTFEAASPARAKQLVANDPFLREGTLSNWWLEPWLPVGAVSTTDPGDRA